MIIANNLTAKPLGGINIGHLVFDPTQGKAGRFGICTRYGNDAGYVTFTIENGKRVSRFYVPDWSLLVDFGADWNIALPNECSSAQVMGQSGGAHGLVVFEEGAFLTMVYNYRSTEPQAFMRLAGEGKGKLVASHDISLRDSGVLFEDFLIVPSSSLAVGQDVGAINPWRE